MNLNEMGQRAQAAATKLNRLSTADKDMILAACAAALEKSAAAILKANALDLGAAEKAGMHPGLVDRLRLTEERIRGMADGLREIVDLPDPTGEVLEHIERPIGLHIEKVRVPLGVVGIIYESRPNVTADAFGLCLKAGNAVILKGGSEAINSNKEISQIIRRVLADCMNNPDALQFMDSTDRAVTADFMRLNQYVDVLIPRGGAGLIRAVVENSNIPVIETGTGNCHIYVDESADIARAIPIIVNAKTQRIGICNACESLVLHEKIMVELLAALVPALAPFNVELRADEASMNALAQLAATVHAAAGADVRQMHANVRLATDEDFFEEFLDYILSVKTVKSLDAAIEHVNIHNTKHSDAIITEDRQAAARFTNEIDAACVYVNTSTRFTDGGVFGLGAEIGISNQKLHARGPMGLRELTSYKYVVESEYLVRP